MYSLKREEVKPHGLIITIQCLNLGDPSSFFFFLLISLRETSLSINKDLAMKGLILVVLA